MMNASLADLQYEIGDFRANRDKYNTKDMYLVMTYEFFKQTEGKIVKEPFEVTAKAVLMDDPCVQIGEFEGVRVFVAFNDMGGRDYIFSSEPRSQEEKKVMEDLEIRPPRMKQMDLF